MKILINADKEKLAHFSKISGCMFESLNSNIDEDTLMVIIRSDNIRNFQSELDRAIMSNVPVVVIAGSKEKASPFIEKAVLNDIPKECIVIKDGDKIMSVSGHVFGASKRGISVKMLCIICEYVLGQGLIPEVFVWEESADQSEPQSKKHPHEAFNAEAINEKGHVNEENLESVLNLGESLISVFKTVPESDSGKVSNLIASNLNAVHLEVSQNPTSFRYYGNNLNEALQSGKYAYSNGKTVKISSRYSGGRWLIVEIDPKTASDAMPGIYEKCQVNGKIIHTVPNLKSGKDALDDWLKPGFKLDAIIPSEMSGLRELKAYFGDRVYDVETFVRNLG